LVSLRIETKLAQVSFGDITALPAERQPVLHRSDRIGEAQRILSFGLQQMKGQPLRALLTDSGKPNQFLDQSRQQSLLIDRHR
jgi:hypothetical protein